MKGIEDLSEGDVNISIKSQSGVKEVQTLINSTNKLSQTLSGIVSDIQSAMDSLYAISFFKG